MVSHDPAWQANASAMQTNKSKPDGAIQSLANTMHSYINRVTDILEKQIITYADQHGMHGRVTYCLSVAIRRRARATNDGYAIVELCSMRTANVGNVTYYR